MLVPEQAVDHPSADGERIGSGLSISNSSRFKGLIEASHLANVGTRSIVSRYHQLKSRWRYRVDPRLTSVLDLSKDLHGSQAAAKG